ncbi:LPS assembly lipoprotein LptE [Acidobacteriota bacterium]
MKAYKIFVSMVACLILFQCGYHLRGTGSSLPSHITKVYIPMFKNQTTRFELDRKLTQSVIDEFISRGKVEIVGDQESADAVLLVDILAFQVAPIAMSNQATADRFSITVTAKIVLRDLRQNKVLFSNPYFPYQDDYQVSEGSDFESVETEAIDEIAEKFARSIILSILEGF